MSIEKTRQKLWKIWTIINYCPCVTLQSSAANCLLFSGSVKSVLWIQDRLPFWALCLYRITQICKIRRHLCWAITETYVAAFERQTSIHSGIVISGLWDARLYKGISILTSQSQKLFYVPPGLIFRNSTFRPQSAYNFFMCLRTNSDFCCTGLFFF